MIYVKGKLFTYIALYCAVFFLGFQLLFVLVKAQNGYELPLLLLLLMNELAMFICLFGVWAGIETLLKQGNDRLVLWATLLCFGFAILFLYIGLQYWPDDVKII